MSRIDMESLLGPIVGDPATMADKHYVRITSEADKPDPHRVEVWPDGGRSFPYGEAGYGWTPDLCKARGPAVYARVRQILGEPMSIPWGEQRRWGYMWRHWENEGQGMLLIVSKRAQSVHLRSWAERDKSRTGRIGVEAEKEIYCWFAWLTTPPGSTTNGSDHPGTLFRLHLR